MPEYFTGSVHNPMIGSLVARNDPKTYAGHCRSEIFDFMIVHFSQRSMDGFEGTIDLRIYEH